MSEDREQRTTEERLRESDQLVRLLLESTAEAIFGLDLSSNCTFCNAAFLRLLGYGCSGQLLGRNMHELIHHTRPDGTPCPTEGCRIYEAFLRGEGMHGDEEVLWRADGTSLSAEYWSHPIRRKGKVVGSVVTLLDVTERKRAEEELRLNESRLEALVTLGHMTSGSLNDITDFALEEAIKLTGSTLGYLAFMNEDETVLTMHSWSKTAMAECRVADKPRVYPVKATGLWGEAVRQRKPIITNDYLAPNPLKKGYPDGHVAVTRHMNIPVFDGNRIVVVAGVGNKEDTSGSNRGAPGMVRRFASRFQ